ncbi:YggS family pyridoxal phosphate-dependent enzyme [Maribellus sp. CM-23]|uniref:YggS family pyridoxal phosphate-dependent enzyme n=1 Tax=Maribellus sp. CM-23 TaxID=2781026 RepID=UPI001F29B939|nr:YggS family pyridoxal phosphate-dependent enzyme [Maribellus sp. CM-23]MCE4564464.1 YggS family pyridoxal phosphate-dependent enzyme [Maribellus sp. CM-23]
MEIANNLLELKKGLPPGVQLVAVSKTKPNEDILEAYQAGQRVFGENKVQDLAQKYEELPKDIEWHFIGHPQTNKVKYMAPFVSLIHGVDSLKLLKTIDKEAAKNKRTIRCLLQFHIAEESTKFGLSVEEAVEMLDTGEVQKLQNVEIAGVMGMATYTDDENQIRKEFRVLHNIFSVLKNKYFSGADSFREISMGMSDDYPLAIEEGSTMIRVGSKIFGERNYQNKN